MKRRDVLRGIAQAGLALAGAVACAGRAPRAEGPRGKPNKFLALLQPILATATGVRLYRYPKEVYGGARNLTVRSLPPLPEDSVTLDDALKNYFLAALKDDASYLTGVLKATQFYADYAIVFEGSKIPHVVLISTSYAGAEIVLSNPINGADSLANLDPIFSDFMENVDKAFNK